MGLLGQPLQGVLNRRRARRATLPWNELEAEAARQGCSPADIFFDRAGLGDPTEAGVVIAAEPTAQVGESRGRQDDAPRTPWRGLDPRPAAGTAERSV